MYPGPLVKTDLLDHAFEVSTSDSDLSQPHWKLSNVTKKSSLPSPSVKTDETALAVLICVLWGKISFNQL